MEENRDSVEGEMLPAERTPPILDYEPTEPARITFLGKSPSELLPISLAIELALQLFMSLLLDGGVTLRACSTAWLAYWMILAVDRPAAAIASVRAI